MISNFFPSNNYNAIILSLYLIQSEEDILCRSDRCNCNRINRNDVFKRANLYRRLCEACLIANKILRSASSSHTQPFQAGGDGPNFGVHCNVGNDELLSRNEFDADDHWQSQGIDEQSANNKDDNIHIHENINTTKSEGDAFRQPHLRAIFQYGNCINDMWRCISLILQITTELADANLNCAVECWDINDGHILLIEAAEHLPSWVDDDVLQGGVGGPEGMKNRCWIVNGKVHLIPPDKQCNTTSTMNEKIDLLPRCEALTRLLDSFDKDPDGLSTSASDSVQNSIQHRIDRTDYTARNSDVSRDDVSSSHWHVAAAALPSSVAYFIQKHPSLVPFIIDSFCENAPKYLKHRKRKNLNKAGGDSLDAKVTDEEISMKQKALNQQNVLGKLFPFEQIVAVPITTTRANFAELVSGRGVIPAFPVPTEYRTVELKRFHRQLCKTALSDNDEKRNPFERAISLGIRLCAGLEWLSTSEQSDKCSQSACEDPDNIQMESLGDVERRLRLFWTRIDAEASADLSQNNHVEDEMSDWIDKAWEAGPKNISHIECDKKFLSALEVMSKCPIFDPELSKSSKKEPCPITKPGMSLRVIIQSGMKNALKWQCNEYNEGYFPTPRSTQLDSDGWMEIKSIDALEEEMKNLSSSATKSQDLSKKRPRRTTRRSRRNFDRKATGIQGNESTNGDTLKEMASGFRAFVEGEGDVEGINDAAPIEEESSPPIASIESLMTEKVNIRPRAFLDALQSMLRDCGEKGLSSPSASVKSSSPTEPDISSYFFEEDLNYEDVDIEANLHMMQENEINPEDDPFSLKNIMEAMDHEIRTDPTTDLSIKNLSVATEDDLDDEAMANLLRSMQASEGAGPARNLLVGMGIPLPRPELTDTT